MREQRGEGTEGKDEGIREKGGGVENGRITERRIGGGRMRGLEKGGGVEVGGAEYCGIKGREEEERRRSGWKD